MSGEVSINQQTTNQRHVTRILEIRHKHENFIRDLSSECGQTVDSFLVLSLPLKVAKSPNLRRLSRDLLLEILDSIADYLKDCNIAVSSWWNGIFQLRGKEEFFSSLNETGLFSLEVNFWALKLSLAYPYRVLAEERPTEPSESDWDWNCIESWSWNLTLETAASFTQCANEAKRNTEANVPLFLEGIVSLATDVAA